MWCTEYIYLRVPNRHRKIKNTNIFFCDLQSINHYITYIFLKCVYEKWKRYTTISPVTTHAIVYHCRLEDTDDDDDDDNNRTTTAYALQTSKLDCITRAALWVTARTLIKRDIMFFYFHFFFSRYTARESLLFVRRTPAGRWRGERVQDSTIADRFSLSKKKKY